MLESGAIRVGLRQATRRPKANPLDTTGAKPLREEQATWLIPANNHPHLRIARLTRERQWPNTATTLPCLCQGWCRSIGGKVIGISHRRARTARPLHWEAKPGFWSAGETPR